MSATLDQPVKLDLPPSGPEYPFAIRRIIGKADEQTVLAELNSKFGLSEEAARPVYNHARAALKNYRKTGWGMVRNGVLLLAFGILCGVVCCVQEDRPQVYRPIGPVIFFCAAGVVLIVRGFDWVVNVKW